MIKRLFDIFASFVGLILLSFFFIIIAVFIKFDSKGKVFYRQERVGRYGSLFKIHKFRTMQESSRINLKLTIGNDPRITRVGFYLRKYKLDELPQLIDVFIGKMSLVGPRPEVKEFIDLYPEDIKQKILSIRPGITDRASLEMIDENEILSKYADPYSAYINEIIPIKQDFYLDYVNNHNFFTDIKIIFDTILKIIK